MNGIENSMDPSQYLPVLFLIVLALGIGFVFLGLSVLLGPKRETAVKSMPFESGLTTQGTGYRRMNVRFYMVALTFLIFDVEIIFLYPWAVKFLDLGWYGFWTMGLFFAILLLGLAYDWKKGALEWD